MSNTSLLGAYGDNSGSALMFRNRIINGDMRTSQRGTSFASVTSGTYCMDRFMAILGGSMVITVNQSTDVPAGAGFSNSLHVDVVTADTTITAADHTGIRQQIEGYNVVDLVGKTFTISFWVKSPKAGTHCVSVRNVGPDFRSYVMEYTVNAANTWEYKTVSVVGGLPTAGDWNFTNGSGLVVNFILAAGSTYQTTANAWQTGNFLATSAQVNCVDDAANNFYITGVQLEAGPVATPFERRPIGVEQGLCYRYAYVTKTGGSASRVGHGIAKNSTQVDIFFSLPVEMRTTPVCSLSNITNWAVSDTITGTIITSFADFPVVASSRNAGAIITVGSGLTAFRPYFFENSGAVLAQVVINAEL